MKRKQLLFYSAFIIILICWLIFSNTIIIGISGINEPREITFAEKEYYNNVSNSFSLQFVGGLTEVFSFDGWAFIETHNDNSNRYTSLILDGKKCYELRFENYISRTPLVNLFPEKSIPNDMVGFTDDFTAIPINDGVYDLYIYCWENETDYGLTFTEHQLQKMDGKIIMRRWCGEQVNKSGHFVESDSAKYCFDIVKIIGDILYVNGWAFIEEQNCDLQKVYIEIIDSQNNKLQYTTKMLNRHGVAEAFNNSLYENSGFMTGIPVDKLSDGQCTMRILLENNDVIYAFSEYKFVKTQSSVDIIN